MEKHLNLVNTEESFYEQRSFPRYPFSFLTFKSEGQNAAEILTFEIKNISKSGMQISLKNGHHFYQEGSPVKGEIHWKGNEVCIEGKVTWSEQGSAGVVFDDSQVNQSDLSSLLCIEKIVKSTKPLHLEHFHLDLPPNLKYWLKADGPFEAFVWQHGDGELSRLQMVMFDSFIEWEDGKGLRTGKIETMLSKETPLTHEDIVEFVRDTSLNLERIDLANEVISHLNEKHLPQEVKDFLKVKLSH